MLTFLHPDQPFPAEFPAGAVLLVDKPLAWTSFDVVNKIRYSLTRRLDIRKYKIGHAGTLDPLATGLLILCLGEYTKRTEEFQAMPKEYRGIITLGATTPSYDLERAIDATFPVNHIDETLVEKVRQQFLGEQMQYPPIFSAVKVEGRRLYKNARAQQNVEITPRPVHIYELEFGPLQPVKVNHITPVIHNSKGAPIMLYPDYPGGRQLSFRVRCSKGTYIRSLAHDLGKALGTGAYLSALQRSAIGDFRVEQAWNMDDLTVWIQSDTRFQR